ncbi:MAG: sulfatase [bacterium]
MNFSNDNQPNIIIIYTDDQGYADVDGFGEPQDFNTPNLAEMAQEGMRFTDFYSAAPICSASRAALLTGRYPQRTGISGVLFPDNEYGLPQKEVTIASSLKEVGYNTACVGKWHLGHQPQFLPTNHGFDKYFGIPYSNDMSIDPRMKIAEEAVIKEEISREKNKVPLMKQEEVIEYPVDQSQLTKRYTEKAKEFIQENQNSPFFLYLAHTMPHIPLYASERFRGSSEHGIYGDVIQEIDWSVGEIINKLKELDIDQNTLIVFASDNGPWLDQNEFSGHAAPLRDGKFTRYEGGFRVPCIMRYPDKISRGKVCSKVVSTIDLLPTIANLVGADIPQDRTIDGKSIVNLLGGNESNETIHEYFYYYKEAVRSGQWKLYKPGTYDEYYEDKEGNIKKHQVKYDKYRLFNLKEDISETNNVIEKYPEIAKRLKEKLKEHEIDLNKDI